MLQNPAWCCNLLNYMRKQCNSFRKSIIMAQIIYEASICMHIRIGTLIQHFMVKPESFLQFQSFYKAINNIL
jgi:hypothetical protein